MAARLAVVVFAVGSIPEVVTEGREALLVPPQYVSALQVALARVIDDMALRRQMGNAAFSVAKKRWGVEKAVVGVLSVVESLRDFP